MMMNPSHTSPLLLLCLLVGATTTTLINGFQPIVAVVPRAAAAVRTHPKPTLSFPQHQLFAAAAEDDGRDSAPPVPRDPLIVEASKTLRRVSWFSWWAQVILSVVSAVTLVFARSVMATSKQRADGLFLAGVGLVTSFLSVLWTWGGARLARRLLRRSTTRIEAANMTRRAVSVGVSLNLIGMFLSLIGAEQIVGGLAIKVLTMQGVFGSSTTNNGVMTQTLQPLDILVVQGNTNTLLSHFFSIVAYLYLTNCVRRLDPPSVSGKERKRA